MSHVLERAPTGRAKCRGCGRAIAAADWRLGERLPNPFADAEGAEMTHWFHPACAAFKRPDVFLAVMAASDEPLADRTLLEQEARLGVEHRRLPRVDAVSRAPSGRAACRACKEPIAKGTWRIGLVYYEDGRFVPSGYIHLACARTYLETTDLMARVRHFSRDLSPGDAADIERALASSPAS
jgi:hypothetical protein